LCTIAFSPTISFATLNPEGRKGLSPTTVLISRSADTLTGGRQQAETGTFSGAIIPDETAAPACLFAHPANPPPATSDTAAMFAFRRKTRLFIIQLSIIRGFECFSHPN
jgi:hypothetical protein